MATTLAPPRSRENTPAAPAASAASKHRADIDGIRAIAVVLVVLYHAHVPGFSAGFIGVDVFFVLSGFLITGIIADEARRTGTVALGNFWLRRFRRLLPSAAVVIGITLPAAMAILSPLRWRELITEAAASAFYVANHLFSGREADYFADGVDSSPFLHMWSLAVEEQFYLVWPLLLFAVVKLAGGYRATTVGLAIGLVSGLSFLVSASYLADGSPLAFYGAFPRAWEFGAGALLAVAGLGAPRRALRTPIAAAALLALIVSLVTISPASFPGRAALLPVIATVVLLAARTETGPIGSALASVPFQYLGRLSYSWYLWHWPAIVLGTAWIGVDGPLSRSVFALASLVPAILARRLIENPIRYSSHLAASARRSAAMIGAVSVAVVLVLGAATVAADARLGEPHVSAAVAAQDDRTEVSVACASLHADELLGDCLVGDPTGERLVVVVGDSHAAHWLPAVDRAGREIGVRVAATMLPNCPTVDVTASGQAFACGVRQERIVDTIADLQPDLVFLAHSRSYLGGLDGAAAGDLDAQAAVWGDAVERFAFGVRDAGGDLVVMLDTPRFPEHPLECLIADGFDGGCGLSRARADAEAARAHGAERAALERAAHGTAIDPTSWLCGPQRCPVTDDGTVMWVDRHHLTATFAASLAPEIVDVLREAGLGA